MILELDDGSPLLIEHRVGAGRLMVLTTALDPAWSSLVVRPAFVTFIADLLAYLAEDLLPVEALVGQPFAIPAQSVQLFDRAGDPVLGLADTIGRPTVSLDRPGIYQLRTPASTRLLAVNADLRESDLERADDAWLERWQEAMDRTTAYTERHRGLQAGVDPPPFAAEAEVDAGRRIPLAPWLLGLLALLVVIEPLLANAGRSRSGPTTKRTEGASAA